MIAPETAIMQIIGPYTGQRISGTSGDVDEVRLTRTYHFDNLIVEVRDIPARLDRATEGIYLAARDVKRLDRIVQEAVDAIADTRSQGVARPPGTMPFKVQLTLPEVA